MTDTVPGWLAKALHNPGPGHAALTIARLGEADVLGRDGFSLRSAAFTDGGELDPSFTAGEEDAVAPPMEWTAPPAGTEELVLIVEDPQTPGSPFCHWVVWGLAGQRGQILEGEAPPRVGKNAFGNSEWLLPDPPLGDPAHDYVFQLFALDLPLALMPGAARDDVVASMKGHVIAAAVLTARFAREEDDLEEWDEDGEG